MFHNFGVSDQSIQNNSNLRSSVDIISTSVVKDRSLEKKSHSITKKELDIKIENLKSLYNDEIERDYIQLLEQSEDQISPDPYVSVFEFKKYPIFGTQFHPEKSLYDFQTNEKIPSTSLEMKHANELFSLFFLDQIFKAKILKLDLSGESKH